ncbi:hypothetical protein [Streptomyces sp. MBT55]|uniref:hypothetical protein n=1 Tax=Streptomyces sp. MBT55 TaxID=1488386 RepID=UPI0019114051|nr:hypothetical protein [Streptomyces sp. MBT55]MBK6040799.1 hypothetical protein [Streptomyces sp. MBT55]
MSTDEAPVICTWTGREIAALMVARRMTNEKFAGHLGVSVRSVAGWRAKPTTVPRPDMQQLLDISFERLKPRELQRFVAALKEPAAGQERTHESPVVMAAEMALMQARIDELQAELARGGRRADR